MQMFPWGPQGILVPAVGQGTWKLEHEDRAQAIRALQRGVDLGMSHIDTAELYGDGVVESLVGEALHARRQEIFLVSKVRPDHANTAGTIAACEASLRRLRTDWLDVYLLHWKSHYPLEQTLAAFDKLQRDGKIRAYGVSNFSVKDLRAALAIAGPGRIACNQVLYNLEHRGIERALMPFCHKHKIAVVAYSPFATGAQVEWPAQEAELEAIAKRHGATPQQVVLAFLMRDRQVFMIPKAAKEKHLSANARAADIVLHPDEIRALDTLFHARAGRRFFNALRRTFAS